MRQKRWNKTIKNRVLKSDKNKGNERETKDTKNGPEKNKNPARKNKIKIRPQKTYTTQKGPQKKDKESYNKLSQKRPQKMRQKKATKNVITRERILARKAANQYLNLASD